MDDATQRIRADGFTTSSYTGEVQVVLGNVDWTRDLLRPPETLTDKLLLLTGDIRKIFIPSIDRRRVQLSTVRVLVG